MPERPKELVARRLVLGILAVGLFWRLVLCVFVVPLWEARANVAPTPDAYPTLARTLLDDGTLGYAPFGASPTTVRGPGFPIWLAVGILVGGDDPRWLGLWGGLPGIAVAAWLTWLVARRFGAAPGIVAGAVAALHPLPSLISARVMGDDFYAALGFAGLAVWCIALRSPGDKAGAWWAVAAGMLLAMQMLTRASGLLTLVAALIVGLVPRKRRAGLSLLLVAVALLPPLLWSVRTSRLEARPVFVHSLGAYNFWIGEGFDRYGAGEGPAGNWGEILPFVLAQAEIDGAEAQGFWYVELDPREAAALDSKLGRAAVERITRDPVGYVARWVKGLARYWYQAQTGRRSLQYLLVAVPVLLLAFAGIRRLRAAGGARDPLGSLLLLAVVLHNVAYAALLPTARMSVQVYPAIAYLAGAGACWVFDRVRRD